LQGKSNREKFPAVFSLWRNPCKVVAEKTEFDELG
jgi:hypothetical protein